MKTLAQLLEKLDHTIIQGSADVEVPDFFYDSRRVTPGSMFICMPGAKVDGHTFIPQVIEKKAGIIVIDHDVDYDFPADVTVVKVDGARKALSYIAAAWYDYPAQKLITIAVTGTKGKTTTAYMIREVLMNAGFETGLIGTIEMICGDVRIPSLNTTPESALCQKYFSQMAAYGCKAVVMEVSSQAYKMDRVAGVEFDYGVFTNLEEDHIGEGEHPDMDDYINCKARLFKHCKHGIFNADADYLDRIMDGCTCDITTYGIEHPADLHASDIRGVGEDGFLGVAYTIDKSDKTEALDVLVDIPGDFTVYNSLAAAAVCMSLNIDRDKMLGAFKTVQVKGRMEIINTPGEYTLMIDYAHNAMALEALLKNLRPHTEGRLISVFGCGGNRAKSRRYEMGEVSSRLSDLTVVTSDNPRFEKPEDIIADIITGVQKADGEYITIPIRKEAIRYVMKNGKKGDIIVLAGKGHEDYQEIEGVKYPMDERVLIKEIIEEEKM